jgi:hypothetical protein
VFSSVKAATILGGEIRRLTGVLLYRGIWKSTNFSPKKSAGTWELQSLEVYERLKN